MAAKSLLFAVVACLACACAQMPGPGNSPPPGAKVAKCDSPKCSVQVEAKCVAYIFCFIHANPDWVQVGPGNSPELTWQLTSSEYTFTDNGIVFADAEEFKCRREEGGRRFVCNNKHSRAGLHKYTITVRGFPFVFPKDPWIYND
jgi:hypothetical protein